MTPVLDDTARRRARVRAVATAIADEPVGVRRFRPLPGTQLRPVDRRRRRAPQLAEPQPRRRDHRRLVAGLVLLLQVGALALVLWLPGFRVHAVGVSGNRLVDTATVLRAAAVPQQSIFTLNGEAIASRVRALPWVRAVTVTTDLPNSVRIAVTEWQPMVRIRRDRADLFLAENGDSLPVSADGRAASAGVPLLIDLRPAAIRTDVSPRLIGMLGEAASGFPGIFGVHVIAYQWDSDGRFSVWTSAGWRAILGHLDTSQAIDAVPSQLAALTVLRGTVNFVHPSFGHVDLENPAAPAVGGSPGIPAEVTAALSGAPITAPPGVAPASIPATATATAAPRATPTSTAGVLMPAGTPAATPSSYP